MPTILLTGASGVVGTALVRELDGHSMIALTHRKPVDTPCVVGDVTRPWLGMRPADYRELAARIDVVVHCAASVNFTASGEHLHRVNVRGVGHVLQFVEDAEARLVHGSTAYVDAGVEGHMSAYAASKATGEILVRESGLPAAIARISTVIGDSQTGHVARLQGFSYLLGQGMWGYLPFLPCEQHTCADFVPQDVAAGALAALALDDTAHGEYWITAGPAALTMRRVVEIGCEIGYERARSDVTLRAVHPSLFKPRLVGPEVCEEVLATVLGQADADADGAPSMIRSIFALASAYVGLDQFPTSLGRIAGGPPSPSPASLERAAYATCRYLASLPRETWNPY